MKAMLVACLCYAAFGCAAIEPSAKTASTTAPEVSSPPGDGDIAMPDVAGLTKEEVLAKLKGAGKVGDISFNMTGMGSDECQKIGAGKAISSSPGAGNMVNRKTPASVDMCGNP